MQRVLTVGEILGKRFFSSIHAIFPMNDLQIIQIGMKYAYPVTKMSVMSLTGLTSRPHTSRGCSLGPLMKQPDPLCKIRFICYSTKMELLAEGFFMRRFIFADRCRQQVDRTQVLLRACFQPPSARSRHFV